MKEFEKEILDQKIFLNKYLSECFQINGFYIRKGLSGFGIHWINNGKWCYHKVHSEIQIIEIIKNIHKFDWGTSLLEILKRENYL